MPIGTVTADGTEQIVDEMQPNAPGFVFWYVDTSNMESGDELIIREYVDIGNEDNYQIHEQETVVGESSRPVYSQSDQLMTMTDVPVQITIEQTDGTNRVFAYATGVKH